MSVTLLSYATEQYRYSQKVLNFSARRCGVDRCISYAKSDLIKTDFYRQYKHILDQPRGAGYWLWKPYYILETLKQLPENEILVYADAGLLFWKNISPLVALAEKGNGIVLFYNYGRLGEYTKRDAFLALGCDEEKFHQAPLIHANLQIYRRTPEAISFLEEVLRYCTQDELITDAANSLGKPNIDGFIDHRHDQSVFSLVAHKRNLTFHLDPSQMRVVNADFRINEGNIFYDKVPYGSIVYMHRYKNRQLPYLCLDVIKKIFRLNQTKKTR